MSGVRPDPGSILKFGRIVVGVDRRQGGRDALALATLLQHAVGGELMAVYVYPFDRTVSLDEADAVEAVLHEDLLAELEQELTRAAVSARPVVVPGVGFDDSAESRAALRLGGRLARATGAALRVVSVTAAAVPGHEAAAIAEGGTYETVAGRPATELARRSADLDLLVVGSRAQGPVRRLLLGSTSTRLVREAGCPVLVVPRPVALADVDEGAQRSTAAR
jgi:nucleotide-binding universal stress UspA family protein